MHPGYSYDDDTGMDADDTPPGLSPKSPTKTKGEGGAEGADAKAPPVSLPPGLGVRSPA